MAVGGLVGGNKCLNPLVGFGVVVATAVGPRRPRCDPSGSFPSQQSQHPVVKVVPDRGGQWNLDVTGTVPVQKGAAPTLIRVCWLGHHGTARTTQDDVDDGMPSLVISRAVLFPFGPRINSHRSIFASQQDSPRRMARRRYPVGV